MNVTLTFPDGKKKEFSKGITCLEVAKSISEGLAREVVAAKLDDKVVDASRKIEKDAKIKFLKFQDEEGKEVFRHSSAHLLAYAVKELFPKALPTIGPVVEEGFYYDFDTKPFEPEDIEKIEKKMKDIVERKESFERIELTRKKANELFKDNKYKLEIIKELKDDEISAYKVGNFVDLCAGPHVPSTGMIKALKLTKLAGAYWRGDAKNKQLQRVYGISFSDKKLLNEHFRLLEEALKRDHRKIGKDLDLFSFHEEGHGFPFWHSNGKIIFNELVSYIREQNRLRGYSEITTPILLNESLWHCSGHYDHFKENMYFTEIDKAKFAVKPMNCPGGLLIYKTKLHSYRELPIKNAELGLVHRHELSGVLHGLFRVRSFTQDDAHVFCTEDQLEDEIVKIIDYTIDVYNTFGFKDISVFVATKPKGSIGTDSQWKAATNSLEAALKKKKIPFAVKEGEGAFYGPKIEFNIQDCLSRNWQCGTVQVDFSMPQRFEVTYEGKDGKKHTPIMVHRAIFGSLERFIGILAEHCEGKFPLWLSPVQVIVLALADRHINYCEKVRRMLFEAGIRVETDFRSESIPKKVREAQLRKIPLILVCGDNEEKNKTVNIRTRDNVVHGEKKTDVFLNETLEKIKKKE